MYVILAFDATKAIGPFNTEADAEDWGAENLAGGDYSVIPITSPEVEEKEEED